MTQLGAWARSANNFRDTFPKRGLEASQGCVDIVRGVGRKEDDTVNGHPHELWDPVRCPGSLRLFAFAVWP